MKINKYFWFYFFLALIFLSYQLNAQPFYYYNDTTSMEKFWRFNLQNGKKDIFFKDAVNPGGEMTWDPTQNWVFINGTRGGPDETYYSLYTIKANDTTIDHLFPDQIDVENNGRQSFTQFYWDEKRQGKRVCDGIVFNPIRNVFYVSRTTDFIAADSTGKWNNFLNYQETAIYDATTFAFLETLPVPAGWITSISSVSDDGNYLYLENWDYQQAKALGKYSLLSKQLIINKKLSELSTLGGNDIEDSKKGKYLLVFLYPRTQMEDKKYALYDVDKDSVYGSIPFPIASNGLISVDGKYVIIEETPVRPDYATSITGDDFLHPGRISVFDGVTGQLIQKLTLPPDGKVLVFDNYPNMLYYYLEKKHKSINIDLTKLVTIGAIRSQNVLVGSGAFILSVSGNNFTPESKVRLNGTNRATIFIADTLLQATIRAADADTAMTAYIAVKDSNGITDSLALNIISIPSQSLIPFLNCISQQNDTTYTAWFGFENDNAISITVPVGLQNKVTPASNDRTQPTVFEPGRKEKAFSVVFNGKNLTWKLNGNDVTASKKSQKCE